MKEEILKKYIENHKMMAFEELDKLGYYGGWDSIYELAGKDVVKAYRLGRSEAIYDILSVIERIIDEDEEVRDK